MRLAQLQEKTMRDVAIQFAKHELALHGYRRDARSTGRSANYFLSSDARRHFCDVVVIAKAEDAWVTPSQIYHQIHVSRQTVNEMIHDTLSEGFIEQLGRGVRATDQLVKDYALAVSTFMTQLSDDLTKSIEKLKLLTSE